MILFMLLGTLPEDTLSLKVRKAIKNIEYSFFRSKLQFTYLFKLSSVLVYISSAVHFLFIHFVVTDIQECSY